MVRGPETPGTLETAAALVTAVVCQSVDVSVNGDWRSDGKKEKWELKRQFSKGLNGENAHYGS